jgi:hypothetical protein
MKNLAIIAVAAVSFAGGVAIAAEVHDWRDLDKVHEHVKQAINEMERARAANHYDMAGHGVKAEQLLRDAEAELHQAVDAAKSH